MSVYASSTYFKFPANSTASVKSRFQRIPAAHSQAARLVQQMLHHQNGQRFHLCILFNGHYFAYRHQYVQSFWFCKSLTELGRHTFNEKLIIPVDFSNAIIPVAAPQKSGQASNLIIMYYKY